MFSALELRFVTIALIATSQITVSLLSGANIAMADMQGASAALPVLIIATNAPLGLATLIILILDHMERSPISVLSEIVLSAAACGVDLIGAVAIPLFSMNDSVCKTGPHNGFWSACSAHFAIAVLLWTSAALLLAYAAVLFYAAKQYRRIYPLAKVSVWKQTVKVVPWPSQTYTVDSPPGRRLRKKGPLDIESLRRVIPDKESFTSSRDVLSTPMPSTPVPGVRPPGLDSHTVSFAERMGYFRRDAMGEYVPSTPTRPPGFQPGHAYRTIPDQAGRNVASGLHSPTTYRRPSFPDLPNPFPPQPLPVSPMGAAQQISSASGSRTPSNSSTGSVGSSPGFAGLGVGSGPAKGAIHASSPQSYIPPYAQHSVPANLRSAQNSRGSVQIGGGSHPLRVSAPTSPANAYSPSPRLSMRPSRLSTTPTSPQFRQMVARPGYGVTHQPARSHLSLTTATIPTPAAGVRPNPLVLETRSLADSPSSLSALIPVPFLPAPPPAMSPSTKQRASNQAYPLPLPSLSTYPIKSVAMSVRNIAQHTPTRDASGPTTSSDGLGERLATNRPLSTVSTVSCYSTSSASHGPPPVREQFRVGSTSLFSISALGEPEDTKGSQVQRSDSASSRRSLKSKRSPLARVPSHHGDPSQNVWGGTGKGQSRRSLASQFQRPQARVAP